jgi:SPP1 gp7 family putative phage head morphogenesis protein
MTITYTDAYRTAFVEYLRRGTPIRLSLKQAGNMDQYVWRTRRDERVRRSHWMNDGRVFSWADPPATGHPGEDYNCRCEAVPLSLARPSSDFTSSPRASRRAMIGGPTAISFAITIMAAGHAVTLLEIGHLREIAEQYAHGDGAEGTFRRLADQIADEARASSAGVA